MEHQDKQRQRLRLVIGGVDYVLLSEKSEDYMQGLGATLNEKITQLMRANGRISATQAAVLCALEAMDDAHAAQETADNLRTRIQEYLEDAARMKKEAALSRHEAELLHREVTELKKRKEGD
ncbi:MAG: cell division protein ZapA [Oscillospiraceae bacterium]|nr:cell division protein ZapA [Oscillospiraceae bacterium]